MCSIIPFIRINFIDYYDLSKFNEIKKRETAAAGRVIT